MHKLNKSTLSPTKLNKSLSNPAKLKIHIPKYHDISRPKQSDVHLTHRSVSGSKKFGIRRLEVSPHPYSSSQHNNGKRTPKKKTVINKISLAYLQRTEQLHPVSSSHTLSAREKLSSKIQYYKAHNMTRNLRMHTEHKRNQPTTAPFKLQPIKRLACGQYGSIYLALNEETNFLVVLKCFDKHKVNLQFMIDEFKIHIYCRHPNILPAYGCFFDKNQVYLIMEAGNCNLYHEIKRLGFLSESIASSYILHILKGLSYLHLNGIIHRDLKPENIIICGGVPKITDFGWSIITNTNRKTYCGTVEYVSPEVSNKQPYGFKIDSWSVGILAYEMVTGRPPFPVLKQFGNDGRPKLNYSKKVEYPCYISWQCKSFIQKMLSIDPQQRPSISAALMDSWIKMHRTESRQNRIKSYKCFSLKL